ncbi:MAG: glycosyltransferase [Alphaproteobacteria bacterium]
MVKEPTKSLTKTPAKKARRKRKPRLLIFIVAYNAEKTIESVLSRIPQALSRDYTVEVLIIDDASQDETFERGQTIQDNGQFPFTLHVLFNPVNQGYGGNQKIGYYFAIKKKFDFVALVHGDGQYAPECLPDLAEPLKKGEADAVFGSRMIKKGAALDGGMPKYKFIGNKILSWFENKMLRTDFSEFHSGYRLYSVKALKKIPFQLNTNDFHFDSEIIVQFVIAELKIKELEIPTYYGDEICHVDGLKYAWDVTKTVLKARAQELSIFYDRRFDCRATSIREIVDQRKLHFDSAPFHTLKIVPSGKRVLFIGDTAGYLAKALSEKGCQVDCLGKGLSSRARPYKSIINHDFATESNPPSLDEYDYILLLDILSLHQAPEQLVAQLKAANLKNSETRFIFNVGNIGFIIMRLMLLIGQFNYGKRGILDMRIKRLFTLSSFQRLLKQQGYDILQIKGIPAPYPIAIGESRMSKFMLAANKALIYISKRLFSYQLFIVAQPKPSLSYLLESAYATSSAKRRRASNGDT